MEKLKTIYDLKIRWHAYELRPVGTPPISQELRERIMAARPEFEREARTQYGLEIKSGELGINTHKAHIAALYARYEGKGAQYHDALLRAYWLEARDISNSEVLVEIGVSVGLNADAVGGALQDKTLDAIVTSDMNRARSLGITDVPALIFAHKYLVAGAQPYKVLLDVVEQLQHDED